MNETLFDIICGIGSSPAAEVASLLGWARANKGVAGARRVLLIDSAYTRGRESASAYAPPCAKF